VRTLAERGAAIVKVSLEPGPGWPMLSPEELDALLDEAHARGLKVVAHAQAQGTRLALDAGVDELAHMPCGGASAPFVAEVARRGIPVVATLHVYGGCRANARALMSAGGTLLYGSDFGNPGIPAGIDVEELRLMVEAGLSRLAVLRTATAVAGRLLGLAPLGTLVPGAPADIVGVRGVPTQNPATLGEPILIVAGGHPVVAEGELDLPPP
jgi:imidazolonepropionase-like amidohydrolase